MLATAIVEHVVDLSLLDALSEADLDRQKAIARARRYHDGEHAVFLTPRLRQFLGIGLDADSRFNLNICRIVVEAVSERLIVELFDSTDDDLKAWAQDVWKVNRMDTRSDDTHIMAVRDGEAFLIVDWDERQLRPRLTPHQAYVAVEAQGDGFGIQMFYPDDDHTQPPLYAVKRWIEALPGGLHRARATYYFPDRIEKYAYSGGWTPIEDEDDPTWPLPWVDGAGEPLGVPVVHFQNKDLRSEVWDALPVQDAINKDFLDLMAAGDMTGFQIFVALGFIPTADGQDLAADGANALVIEPGQIIGTTKNANEADFKALPAADLKPLLEKLQKDILFSAIVTNTPTSRFQITGMVSAEQSQKQAEEPLLAKVRKRQATFGDAWEDVMDMARRLENLFGEGLPDDELNVQWSRPQARTDEERAVDLRLKKELGVPRRQLWSELGYDDEKIDEMLQDPEVRATTFTDFP